MALTLVAGSSEKPNMSTRMPGKPKRCMVSRTSAVMTPKSSAISGQTDEAVPQFGEEILRRGLHPPPVDGGRFTRRDLPVGHESPEMVDSNVVEQGQIPGEPSDPPLIAGFAVSVPTVDRVAPELAVGAEVIRWNAGHRQGAAGFVQLKKTRVSPHIRAVERHIDGQIPENADPLFPAVGSQPDPLPVKEILDDFQIFKTVAELRSKPCEGFGVPLLNFVRPPVPDRVGIARAQRGEQRHSRPATRRSPRRSERSPHPAAAA